MVESAPPSGFSDRQRLHQRGRRVRLRSHATSARTLRIQFAGKNFKNYFISNEIKIMENYFNWQAYTLEIQFAGKNYIISI